MSGDDDLFGDQNSAPSPFSGPKADLLREKLGAGRPKGARNKKSADFEKFYYAKGFKDPLVALGELLSENPLVLQAWFQDHAGNDAEGKARPAPSILEVINMQIRAAGELAPYLHGKKPIEIDIKDERLPQLIIALGTNQLAEALTLQRKNTLSIGAPIIEQNPSNSGPSEEDE